MLDTLRRVTTPELIELELHPAGLLPRSLAWLLDLALRVAAMLFLGVLAKLFGNFGAGLYLLIYFLLDWFYPVYFEVRHSGSTPGKKALGLMVVDEKGTPVGWGASLTRNLLRVADLLPFAYGTGMICMLCHPEFRRLGDIVAGTLVVYQPKTVAIRVKDDIEVLAPTTALDRSSQRALLDFAERAGSLTTERQEELAALLPWLARAEHGPQGAARLLGLAAWLSGRRA